MVFHSIFGVVFTSASGMSGHTGQSFLSLKEYLDLDAALPDGRHHFQGIMTDLKNLRGPSHDLVFAAGMKKLCDFVSHSPETFHGRAFLCHLARTRVPWLEFAKRTSPVSFRFCWFQLRHWTEQSSSRADIWHYAPPRVESPF
jgi:hypothetical protein